MDNSNEVIEIYLNSKVADVISSDFNSDVTFYIPNIEIDKKKSYTYQ